MLVLLAGIAAGAVNAVAGGGSFLSFPALVFAGVPPLIANASNNVATCPGSLASAWGYRADFARFPRVSLWAMLAVGMAGGTLGAFLLLYTPERAFDLVIPWLLLAATLLFAAGRHATAALQRHITLGPAALLSVQFLISIYGGYFGGAQGILMLALYGLFGLADLNAMNAMKSLMAGTVNGIAVLWFILAGKVQWDVTLILMVGALIGGYGGARLARRVKPAHLRLAVIAIGAVMSVVFFARA